jgi:hypothetical protein
VLGGRWRPRKFGGRISQQARDYITRATVEQLAAIDHVIDAIEAGGEEAWERIPWSMAPSQYDNLVVVLLPHGDVFVWKGYADYPQYYSIIYIGPGHLFH